MICTPCLSDLHEFCRDDVRDCDCDCARWLAFGGNPYDGDLVYSCDDLPDEPDPGWQDIVDDGPAQDRYERGLLNE